MFIVVVLGRRSRQCWALSVRCRDGPRFQPRDRVGFVEDVRVLLRGGGEGGVHAYLPTYGGGRKACRCGRVLPRDSGLCLGFREGGSTRRDVTRHSETQRDTTRRFCVLRSCDRREVPTRSTVNWSRLANGRVVG